MMNIHVIKTKIKKEVYELKTVKTFSVDFTLEEEKDIFSEKYTMNLIYIYFKNNQLNPAKTHVSFYKENYIDSDLFLEVIPSDFFFNKYTNIQKKILQNKKVRLPYIFFSLSL